LAAALDTLLSAGPLAFHHAIMQLGDPTIALTMVDRRPVASGPEAISAYEAVALVRAIAAACRELAAQIDQEPNMDLAEALDELEYIPCEFLRLGSAFVTRLSEPGDPQYLIILLQVFEKELYGDEEP
jgi:hypothetical protein